MSSWPLELTNSRTHDFGTSGAPDFWISRCQDFNPYWFPDIIISWWIEFKIYSICFSSILFPMSASGTGGSPLQIGRRTNGNGTWYSTRFWVPEHCMFWTQQAVFSVTRNIFGNAKPLARKGGGGKLLRSRRFLSGPPWPNSKFNRRRFFKLSSPKIGCQGGKNCDFKEGKR